MAVHTIHVPDWRYGQEMRTIIWDDVAGTATGTHSKLRHIQAVLAEPTPVDYSDFARRLYLKDPAHSPADFLWLLWTAYYPIWNEPLRSTLPPVFDGVEPTPMEPAKRAMRDKDGNILPYYEDGSFIGFDAPYS